MASPQKSSTSIPFPSDWGIHATIAGRPIIWGVLTLHSITNNRVSGTINFRGTPIPINGYWNESSKQLTFQTPYASFSGHLTLFDDAGIHIRHLLFSGPLIMNPPSLQAGEHGTWIATTNTNLTGPPIKGNLLPPAGVFVTSNLLYGR
ncbi:hypothetical protein [Heyndrickxia ginsengihumi]|uniref:Uncharacterized protein n=1 Tax=Heyndrickxia ginsengihumi TaxID=363870 RepID=A0A0A6VDX5_9BACI|nr:hypothetical protein [Heyndrickxia ginsengihumi]KHD86470.1 hypothetical protein NG54_03040 [Heyndrickxia ginsengihumi]MBE6183937.1 hypothetical protein [Bacillus sp. (in: firmicutes)]MCM3023331.1 hypothetical protein [Heyndrickxia ginsengihumi]NEY19223.1 hypothetical protein [Heyndrickxia ginsengihumi]